MAAFLDSGYLVDYPFIRKMIGGFVFKCDVVLGPEQYYEIMIKMLNAYSYDIAKASERLWILKVMYRPPPPKRTCHWFAQL